MPIIAWNAGQNVFQIGDNTRPDWTDETKEVLLNRFLESGFPARVTLDQFLRSHPDSFDRGVIVGLHRRHIISWSLLKDYILYCANHPAQPGVSLELIRRLGANAQQALRSAYQHLQQGNHAQAAACFSLCAKEAFNYIGNVFIGISAGNVRQGAEVDQGEDIYEWDGQQINSRDSGLLRGTQWQGLSMVAAQMAGVLRSMVAGPSTPVLRKRKNDDR